MKQQVRVKSVNPDGTAQVVHLRQSACSGDCHKCAGCGAAQEAVILTARNPIGARPGDLVQITGASGPVLAGAAVLYMLPVALFFAGYLVGDALMTQGALGGGIGFFAGIGICVAYDRLVAGKQKNMYTITGYVEENPSQS